MKPYVCYYRVSTKKQTDAWWRLRRGESITENELNENATGLGLDAQKRDAGRLVDNLKGSIAGAYTEVETGKKSARPELRKALAHARMVGGILVVAKLDRLARNLNFISNLMESKVPFICADRPDADRLRLHIEAAFAEEEARRIGLRTKAALDSLQARGVKLGSARPGHWDGREHLRGWKQAVVASAANRLAEARAAYEFVLPEIQSLRQAGKTLAAVAAALNERGCKSREGKAFTAILVWRILDRFA
jgi:DNA invertase Pin-like site-specific DNA recombinase